MCSSDLLAALAALTVSGQALAEIGRVKIMQGPVAIQRNGQKLTPAAGFLLESGDVIVTGKGGRVGIAFADNSRFAVGPDSRVSLDRFDFDRTRQNGSFVTSVQRGTLSVVSGQIAKSKTDAMKVRTPTSLLGVRGTRFVVSVP